MKFYSTRHASPIVGLQAAVMNGLAPDGGLYMPAQIPRVSNDFITHAGRMSFPDVAWEISRKFFMPDVPPDMLQTMIGASFNFDVPLVALDTQLYALELFHGPTGAFKDFAARFMARLFGFFAEKLQQEITILVATSGDTGSAVAHGFRNVAGIKVIILYPHGKVSPLQETQLTGMGARVTVLAVQGTFDDCQKLAKQAFLDQKIKERITLASANSINIARLLPQSFYYWYLCAQLNHTGRRIVISVPSGNFGNLTAGMIAKRMGAPITKFVAATNCNNVVPKYLHTGQFRPKPSVVTISNAMDVGHPSNFSRMQALYDMDVEKMRGDIWGASFSDEKTKKAIVNVWEQYHYIMDPHGAVAYLGLRDFMKTALGTVGVFLETAHPSKFADPIEKIIDAVVPVPERLRADRYRKKQATLLENSFSAFKNFLLSR